MGFCSTLNFFCSLCAQLTLAEWEFELVREENHRTEQKNGMKGKNCTPDRGDLTDIRTVGSGLFPLICILNSQNL